MVETLDSYLEKARQTGTPVQLVLGGNYESPVTAIVTDWNGPTFQFSIGNVVLKMDLGSIVVRTA